MNINHIYIVSEHNGQDADELVQAGLTEGSNRIHPGQGTRNRKFYFRNFFLEIVWIYDEKELKNPITASTGLYQRMNFRAEGYSPYGICLDNTPDTADLFINSIKYRPGYIPENASFDILKNDEHPWLPWTCRLPDLKNVNHSDEPMDHRIGIRYLTGIKIGIPHSAFKSWFTELLSSRTDIFFEESADHHIFLEFDKGNNEQTINFDKLPLTIKY